MKHPFAQIFRFSLILVVLTTAVFQPQSPVYSDKALVCGTPGFDGPITTLSGVVNSYYPGTGNPVAGATSIPVGTARTGGGAAIAAGDLLLVVQMQGADIALNNDQRYGSGIGTAGTVGNTVPYTTGEPQYAGGNVAANYSAGLYEYVVATGPVAAGSVPISSGLVNGYFNSNNTGGATQGQRRYQVIRVPQYSSATLSGTVTALRWDGTTGGIVAFDVAGALNWNGNTVDVSALGFRGGGGRQLAGGAGANTDYLTLSTNNANGSKGEGYAGTPRYLNDNGTLLTNAVEGYPNGSYGRGAAGNGGGGSTDGNPAANDQNSGGGGGGNGGYGGMGGNAWNSGVVSGGFGGAPFGGSAPRLILGGGGGAGTTNNGTGTPGAGFASSGAAGGGVVMIRAGTISGTGTINANGATAYQTVLNDGGGGGGAAGSVVVIARNGSGNVGTLTVTAVGGNGSVAWPAQTALIDRHGPGGGGGGGFVYTSGAVTGASSVAGGLNGTTINPGQAFGATPGGAGVLVTSVTPATIPDSISGANCVPVSLTTTKTTSTPIVAAGNTATYTITASNAAGAGGASRVSISDVLPSGFTYASTGSVTLSGNAVRTVTSNPTVGTGTPAWGTFLIPGGGSVQITFTVNVSATTPLGTYQNPATSTFDDPVRTSATTLTSTYDPASSTGEDVTVVALPPAISKAFSPNPILAAGTSILTFTITNPNTAIVLHGVAFSDTLPTTPGQMTVANPTGVTTTGCGAPTFAPLADATLLSFSGGTIAASGTCTITVNVTASVVGTYNNTSGAVTSTESGAGNTANASLTENPAVSSCVSGQTLAAWNFDALAVGANAAPAYSSKAIDVATATSAAGSALITPSIAANGNSPANDWESTSNYQTPTVNTYFEFSFNASNYTGLAMSFAMERINNNGPTSVNVQYSVNGAAFVTSSTYNNIPNGSYIVNAPSFGTNLDSIANVRIRLYPYGATNNSRVVRLDDVVFTGCRTVNPPSMTKAFAPATIAAGGTSTLTFTITNPNTLSALNGVSFSDVYPVNVVNAATPSVSNTCGGTVTAAAGDVGISLVGGSIAASGSCTVSVNVTSAIGGSFNNTSSAVTSTNGGVGNTANAVLIVVAPPTIAKAFGAATVALNGTTTLTFTLTNPAANTVALTGVAFTDTLPSGLTVPTSSTSQCGGTLTTTAGTGVISLSSATIAVGGTCTFNATVTGTTAGLKNNTTGAVTSTNGGTGTTASASTTVVAPPTIAKAFGAATIPGNGTTTLTFTLTNPAANTVALTGVAFSDTLPSGLTVPTSSTSQCGGTLTTTAGTGVISLSSATIAVGGTCTFNVTVTGATAGLKNNTTGAVTSTNSGTGTTASASTTVVAPPSISKAFSPNSISVGGTSTLTFTITNPIANTVALTGVAFTDTFPAGLQVAGTPNATTLNCGSPTFSPAAAATTINFSNGSIAVGGSCVVTVDVTATTSGAKNNTSGTVSSTNGGTGNTANSTLTVNKLILVKSVAESYFAGNGNILHYSYLVTNEGSTSLAGPMTVADDKSTNESCPSFTTVGNFDSFLDPGENITCTATYTIVAADTAAGFVTNNASATTDGVTSNTGTKTVNKQLANFGHLPSAYTGMNLYNDGGAVNLTGTTYLGASVTSAADGINTASYTPKSSDDGVTWTPGVTWSVATGGSVNVTVTCPSAPCYLNAWFDWNKDNDFNDTGEQIFTNQAVNNGLNTLTFSIPAGAVLDGTTLYARFRLTSGSLTSPQPNGTAMNGSTALVGETEDPFFQINSGSVPTPVTVSYFIAQSLGTAGRNSNNISFVWSTATETGNVGFNLYVKSGKQLVLINKTLIPSRTTDSLSRQDYSFNAIVKGTVFYIEDVSVLGETDMHGPFKLGEKYGDRLNEDKIDQAAIQAEHQEKVDDQQDELKQELTVPEEALQATAVPTATPRPTKTSKLTETSAPSTTPTRTSTPTFIPASTATSTPSETESPTSTPTPTSTGVQSPSGEATATGEPIIIIEPTGTATSEATSTATTEPTATATSMPTFTATEEQTVTPAESATAIATSTPTSTATAMTEPSPSDPIDQLTATLNFKVRKNGLYRVTYEMLRDAGLDLAGVPSMNITLYNRGQSVPVYVNTQTEAFGPGSFIEFYGEALDTIYTDTNVYTLQVRSVPVEKIQSVNAEPSMDLVPPVSYTETLIVNNQRAFSSTAPGIDSWYDTRMLTFTTPKSWNFDFQVNGVSTGTPATLELIVWGVTNWPQDPDHHLTVALNGIPLANATFDGMKEKIVKINLPSGLLKEGVNTLQLTLPGDTGAAYDIINLDKFSVAYQRAFQAQNGQLAFSAASGVFKVTNLPSANVIVYRINAAGLTRLENVNVQASASTFIATFGGTNNESKYLVVTAETLYIPNLEATRLQVDLNHLVQYLIISHPDFIAGLQPLVQAHQAQGLTVSVVDVNDLYTQYNDGIFDPRAIKRYIAYAAQNLGVKYVLLVGGDTYDYRNFTGKNSISFIPSIYTSTSSAVKLVPTDPSYADVNGDNVPDLAIGRFPVRTAAELNMMVTKTLAYANKNYGRTAVFTSDLNDGTVSFKDISVGMAAGMPAGWSTTSIHLENTTIADARAQLIAAMNSGSALVTFTGHSAPTIWSNNNLFNTTNAAALTNNGRPFVVIQWGCWNTYYVDPVNNFLVQKFLFSGNQGAAAAFGAVTLTESESERLLGELLMPRLTTSGMPMGQALQDAKIELAKTHPELLDVILGWTIMGDPALVIEP